MVFCARNCIEECRLRLFQVKTSLGKCFTPLCVFGSNGKYGQTEIALHFDCKKTPRFYALILPSMYFRITHPERERERERERESHPHCRQAKLWPSSDRAAPTAQIASAKLPLFSFLFLNSSSPSCSTSLI